MSGLESFFPTPAAGEHLRAMSRASAHHTPAVGIKKELMMGNDATECRRNMVALGIRHLGSIAENSPYQWTILYFYPATGSEGCEGLYRTVAEAQTKFAAVAR